MPPIERHGDPTGCGAFVKAVAWEDAEKAIEHFDGYYREKACPGERYLHCELSKDGKYHQGYLNLCARGKY